MPEPPPGLESDPIADGFTVDRWLGGRLVLVQPRDGHRVGTDAALLAAASGDCGGTDRRRRRGRRRGRTHAGAAVGAGVRRSDRDRSRSGAACRDQRRAQRTSGARPRPDAGHPGSPASGARPGSLAKRPIASSPTRRSSNREPFAPPRIRSGRGRMCCGRRRGARRSKPGFAPRSPSSGLVAGSS